MKWEIHKKCLFEEKKKSKKKLKKMRLQQRMHGRGRSTDNFMLLGLKVCCYSALATMTTVARGKQTNHARFSRIDWKVTWIFFLPGNLIMSGGDINHMHFIGSKFWSLSLKLGPRSQRLKWRLFSPGGYRFQGTFWD